LTASGQRIIVPTFADRGVTRGQRGGAHRAVNLCFPDRNCYFPFKKLHIYANETDWSPFQIHYYLGDLVEPRIERWTSGSAARNSDHETTEVIEIFVAVTEMGFQFILYKI
jgi:hypothetical protein